MSSRTTDPISRWTVDHLLEYLRAHDISGAPCTDELPYELGTIWPMPGGLAEYARWLVGDDVFIRQMNKDTEEARSINCTACGYHSCREMANAIYYGFTRKENCIHYLKDSVESQRRKLQYVAEHDDYLDVYNRRALIGRVEALPEASEYALVDVNLNGFKGINDTYGYSEAEKLLVQVAENLKRATAK